MTGDGDPNPTKRPWSRRRLLAGGGLATAGLTVGGVAGAALHAARSKVSPDRSRDLSAAADLGAAVVPFHGAHQAGVTTPPQANGSFIAFDLRAGVNQEALRRMMRLLSDDASRLTAGISPLADTEPHLAGTPAGLTVTFGFGPGLFTAASATAQMPTSMKLPAFAIDRLQDRWTGGDLLIQICADDPVTVSHAQRMLVKDARSFATVRWVQRGFRRAAGATPAHATQRNLMGQVDGTIQPDPDSYHRTVWAGADQPDWLAGGTTLVLRRIRIELETWDAVDTPGKEATIGRRLDTGAPLTGELETDAADFAAADSIGLPVIDTSAHIRRARASDPDKRILRRPYNYDDGLAADGTPDLGLIFVAYQADIGAQFLPIQQRLAETDRLNTWTTPIGSATFAIPPGCEPGDWVGHTLLT